MIYRTSYFQRSLVLLLTLSVAAVVVTHASSVDNNNNTQTSSPHPEDPTELIQDREVVDFLTQETRALTIFGDSDEEGEAGGKMMDRCGNRNACADGLDCTNLGIVGVNRCLPMQCLREEFATMPPFDYDAFEASIYSAAKTSKDQLIETLVDAKDRETFTKSDRAQNVMKALQNTAKNDPSIQAMEQAYDNCNVDSRLQDRNRYMGVHIEAGALAKGSFSWYEAEITGELGDVSNPTYIRGCLGAEFIASVEISFLMGIPLDGNDPNITASDLQCGSFWYDVDGVFLIAAGVAIGIQFNGLAYFEYTLGAGAGISTGPYFCYACQNANTTATSGNTTDSDGGIFDGLF